MAVVIDALMPADWEVVRAIFAKGIATGHATFELAPPSWEEWNAAHQPYGRLAARTGGALVERYRTPFGA